MAIGDHVELTEQESKFVRPYLEMKAVDSKNWLIGAGLGVLICIASPILKAVGVLPSSGAYMLFGIVVGMVIIEKALDSRRKKLTARVLQKYDRSLQTLMREFGEEETL
jgi:hypothetical protein